MLNVCVARVTALLSAACALLAAHLVVNLTPSLPRGVYWLSKVTALAHGDLVAFPIPEGVRDLVHERRYLPDRAFLIKPIIATAGDRVCADAGVLTVNGVPLGAVLTEDPAGRPLPHPRGCGELGAGQIYVASAHPRSFDSRVFGAIREGDVRGRVTPLWIF
jgi:conjugative transfer signal peptidase TraF